MPLPFVSQIFPSGTREEPALWFVFQGDRMLVSPDETGPRVPCFPGTKPPVSHYSCSRYFGTFGSLDCIAVEVPDDIPIPPGMEFRSLRSLFQILSDDVFSVAGRARQVLYWHTTHRFCGVCGTPMEDDEQEQAKRCPACAHLCYPRLSPAVIMSVSSGNKILLARSPHFPAGMYSPLAGFVEPGETLEEAVKREVREEVSLEVRDIRYVASQPWPFPHSLMLGFTTKYGGGELAIDNNEIEDAHWFSPDNLPILPSPRSLARLLINRFLEQNAMDLAE
ncbi:MAG: NAD(+) diphosphatase [Proteobacteria bacterium]|nr:NAD(+) diphosphatase [Pseudomonadota bacterium]MBU1416897.1 NAD(+) diphosphatase [Pseudomonadota bacterium]MBU1454332.1 NAD(+) diphosphatase [Pseudomonadota bacterium]